MLGFVHRVYLWDTFKCICRIFSVYKIVVVTVSLSVVTSYLYMVGFLRINIYQVYLSVLLKN